jgi:Predicted transcriptional regulators
MVENTLQRSLEIIEAEINFYKQQTAISIIEIGKRLIEAKSQLKHGEWGKWLEEKVDFTDRTAQRFIKVANEFPTSMSHLGSGKLFKLLDVPTNKREEFIESHDLESLTTREVEKAVKEWKQKDNSDDIWHIVDKIYDDNTYDIPIINLKSFPNHSRYFWNMTGKNYIDFLTSVEESGVINPIIITRDNMIISGHQRVRACKDLGIDTIPARYFYSDNPQNRNLNDLLLSAFFSSNMHTRTSVFWLACAWHDLYFDNGDKIDYYKQKFMEHDDKKLDKWRDKIKEELKILQRI